MAPSSENPSSDSPFSENSALGHSDSPEIPFSSSPNYSEPKESRLFSQPFPPSPQSSHFLPAPPFGPGQKTERPRRRKREISTRWLRPLIFYLLTWLSTTWVGTFYSGGPFWTGLWFSLPLMIILTSHEMGHFLQSKRYRVRATWPYFIPIPFPPFGTFGAVIQMDSRIPHIRALFDIGISGPLAGLVPTLIFLVIGIKLSHIGPVIPSEDALIFGEPLIFKWVSQIFFDRSQPGTDLILHPIGMAAWTGLFITSLNLIPLGQLDGGHVFYALLKRKAARLSSAFYFGIIAYIILAGRWEWILMTLILAWIGVRHPPTQNDFIPLGRFRTILGWLTLGFIIIGFTPNPISQQAPPPKEKHPPIYSRLEESPSPTIDGVNISHPIRPQTFFEEQNKI